MIKSSVCSIYGDLRNSISLYCVLFCVFVLWYVVAATVQFPQGDHECFILSHFILLSLFPSKYKVKLHSFTLLRTEQQWYSASASQPAPAVLSDHHTMLGFCLTKQGVWAGRLNDPKGKIFSELNINGLQQSEKHLLVKLQHINKLKQQLQERLCCPSKMLKWNQLNREHQSLLRQRLFVCHEKFNLK